MEELKRLIRQHRWEGSLKGFPIDEYQECDSKEFNEEIVKLTEKEMLEFFEATRFNGNEEYLKCIIEVHSFVNCSTPFMSEYKTLSYLFKYVESHPFVGKDEAEKFIQLCNTILLRK